MTQPITAFDKPTLRALRPEIERLLAPLAARGLRVRVGNARFTDTTADFKLELAVDRPAPHTDGTVRESKEARAFRVLAPVYGLRADQLGATLAYDGTIFRIVGLRANAPKRPIILEAASGRRVVAPPELVLGALARAAA